MKQDIMVPEVGESVQEGVLAAWLKNPGDFVQEGDDLFELETDKATLNVPSPASGVLTHGVEADTEVEVGQVVGQIDTEASAAEANDDSRNGNGEPSESPAKTGTRTETPEGTLASGADASEADLDGLPPAARRAAVEHGVDPKKLTGTGKGGRVTKEDVLQAVSSDASAAADTAPARSEESVPSAPTRPQTATAQGGQTRKKLSNLRKKIAANLVASKQNSAHLTTFNEVDMSRIMAIRSAYKDQFEKAHDIKLGFMSFFVKAATFALQAYPEVNAYLEENEVVYNHFYNIGVALSTERGLMTPVLKSVEHMSFADIERTIIGFIDRAGEKKLMPDDLTGGTFTISNGGVFGSMLSTPIPNPPQTAVLGMHTIQKRAVVVNDEIVVRPMMYLALSYDHRMIDGKDAIGFLKKIKEYVEDPTQMLIGL
ncbi:MAG: 2-oxoglutarate dehydrogenase complex dihydrolipoyllysine-residue succinyltransferase [Spirochaetaceae bacterium]|nr:MAG: 2-oxoglutarate dehydrogenase complex dihydrolipoyllysine-residue succinyltransferase [Spirochaetaceae bacterium]